MVWSANYCQQISGLFIIHFFIPVVRANNYGRHHAGVCIDTVFKHPVYLRA